MRQVAPFLPHAMCHMTNSHDIPDWTKNLFKPPLLSYFTQLMTTFFLLIQSSLS
ncbi:unnamed protein product, partial [Musa acuminata subsp. burmannicoides]